MEILFGVGDTAVPAEENPELVELSRQHNEIVNEFNTLNQTITSEEVPSKPGKQAKKRYNELGRKVDSLEERMLEWEARAKRFIMHPQMGFISEEKPNPAEQRYVQGHVINFIETMRGDIQSNRVLLASNYNRLTGEAKESINFWYAIWSFRVACIGLFLALVGLFSPYFMSQNRPVKETKKDEQVIEPSQDTPRHGEMEPDTTSSVK